MIQSWGHRDWAVEATPPRSSMHLVSLQPGQAYDLLQRHCCQEGWPLASCLLQLIKAATCCSLGTRGWLLRGRRMEFCMANSTSVAISLPPASKSALDPSSLE